MPMTKKEAIHGAEIRNMGKNWAFRNTFEWLWDRAFEAGVHTSKKMIDEMQKAMVRFCKEEFCINAPIRDEDEVCEYCPWLEVDKIMREEG